MLFGKNQYSVSGVVRDKETNIPISSVNIWNKKQKSGTVSDSVGNYKITFEKSGNYEIIFKNIKYETEYHTVNLTKKNIYLDVMMKPVVLEFKGVVVEGTNKMSLHNDINVTARS